MEHRPAVYDDIPQIMEIIGQAQRFLKENGVDQWQNGYPNAEVFKRDIDSGGCFVYFCEGKLVGVICLYFKPDPCYKNIFDGDWLNRNAAYATIHRNAVSELARGQGVARQMFTDAQELARSKGMASIRVDTHRNNKAMIGLLNKLGFTLCGAVNVECEPNMDAHRLAFEKVF